MELVMPKGPCGEKCPADVIDAVIMVGRIATGDAEVTFASPNYAQAIRVALWEGWINSSI
jgi:hypothetical protein